MGQLILSICIPTYNRYDDLEYLLKSIVSQLDKDHLWSKVEVCISDNASTDNTRSMVQRYQQLYPQIRYHQTTENLGFDRNLLQAVAIANGTYCWLFGSDDRVEDNGIVNALKYIEQYPSISGISVNVQNYNNNFSKKVSNPRFRLKKDFIGNNASDIYITLGQCFSFISGQIINKKRWDEVVNNNDLSKYCKGYIHLYVIAKVVYNGPKWVYKSRMIVGWREGNDSALSNNVDGYIKRLRLDYGYFDIALDIFGGNSWVYYRHGNQVCGQFIFANLQNMKANAGINISPLFKEITVKFWMFPNYYIKILPLFILPKSGIDFVKMLKRRYRKLCT